jgi:hypothetical protein
VVILGKACTVTGMPADSRSDPHHPTPIRDASRELLAAATQAEYQTGVEEQDESEARRNVGIRIARMIGGFILLGVGIAAIPLPGPGWMLIIVGLSLLPFAWAERTVRAIRRRVPGVPEDGRIPTLTWVVMGALLVGISVVSVLFGAEITKWVVDLFAPRYR